MQILLRAWAGRRGGAVDSPMMERPRLAERSPGSQRQGGTLDPAYISPSPFSSRKSYSKNGASGLNVTSSGRPAMTFLAVVIFTSVMSSCSSLHFFAHLCLS